MATLIKTDRNGTKYWLETRCTKCGGTGWIDAYKWVEGGVCFLCGGTGRHDSTWKEYTPEYAKKLADRRLAKAKALAPEKNAKTLATLGFSPDGKAWIVLGDTFAIKEQLKAEGARYWEGFGWHFDHEVDGYETAPISIDDVTEKDEAGIYLPVDPREVERVVKEIKDQYAPKSTSEWIGEIGDRITTTAIFRSVHFYTTSYGYSTQHHSINVFDDGNGNAIVWNTTAIIDTLEEGKEYTLTGTIKKHNEYRGTKQTEVARCKITAKA